MTNPVIRTIDIETAPDLAHVWTYFKANIGINQVLEDSYIMSYAYKDLGSEDVYYADCRDCYRQKTRGEKAGYRSFVKGMRDMLEESDITIAHNGNRFDIPWINGQCAINRLKPPSPFRQIDTLIEARRNFRFPSYKLEYLTKRFGCSRKLKHNKYPGHDMWMECVMGNMDAWEEMKYYNVNDVEILEELYIKMRPWFRNHPNLGVFMDAGEPVCAKCGGTHFHSRGYYYTNLAKYNKKQCQSCGGWSRERVNLLSKEDRKALLTNAL